MGDVGVDATVIDLLDEFSDLFNGKEELVKLEKISTMRKDLKIKYQNQTEELSNALKEIEKKISKTERECVDLNREEYIQTLETLSKRKDELLKEIQYYKSTIKNHTEQIGLCEKSLVKLRTKKDCMIRKEEREIYNLRKLLATYKASSGVVFDVEAKDSIRGTVLCKEDCDFFNIDPNQFSAFEITNQIWDKLEIISLD